MPPREQLLTNLWPLSGPSGDSTRGAQTTYEGAIYDTPHPIDFNRIVWRTTAANASTGRFLFYQSPRGTLDDVYNLLAQATAIPIAASGLYQTPLDSGEVARIEAGRVFVLWGRDSAGGAFTVRTFALPVLTFYNLNIFPGGLPAAFSTALAATGAPPATIVPSTFTASSSNVAPNLWLRRV